MSWERLDHKPGMTPEQVAEQRRLNGLFARVFGSADGLEVLALLRSSTIEKPISPDAPHSALVHLEGQRANAPINAEGRPAQCVGPPGGATAACPRHRNAGCQWTRSTPFRASARIPGPSPRSRIASSPATQHHATSLDWMLFGCAAKGRVFAPKLDVAAAVQAHQQATERASQVPADAGAYKVELPADLQLPEGMTFEVADGDPLLSAARSWAHQAGLTQAQFSGLMGLRAQMDAAAHEAAATAMKAEVQALGDKATERIDGATTFLRSKLPADQFDALKGAITTAKGVEAVETLLKLATGPQLPGGGGGPVSEAVSTEDYYKNLFNSK